MRRCYACGKEIDPENKIARTDECPRCARDLHCCRNCRHYDPAVHNQCREPVAEWISEKERANFCDYFSFGGSPDPGREKEGKPPQEDAREKWRRLFKS